ncbi:MAG: AAA family ATPase, partial [Culicoidibacterales bacterium]
MLKLSKFTIQNFKSIHQPITVDFNKTSIHNYEDQLIFTQFQRFGLFKLGCLLGTNNVGKSNIIQAMSFLQKLVVLGGLDITYNEAHVRDVKNWNDLKQPTRLQIELIGDIEGVLTEFIYTIEFGRHEVIHEELVRSIYPRKNSKGRAKVVFQRQRDHVSIGAKTKRIDPTRVFLRYLMDTALDDHGIGSLRQWFYHTVILTMGYMNADFFDLYTKYPSVEIERINDFLSIVSRLDPMIETVKINEDRLFEIHSHNGKVVNHTFKELSPVVSSGTYKLMAILPHAIHAIETGATLMIDDLSNSLDTNVFHFILEMFLREELNPQQSQLIFTTTQAEVLDFDLRRDQFFIIDFDFEAYTTIVKNLFEDVKHKGKSIRNDLKLKNRYLQGSFSYVPNVEDLIDFVRKQE